MNDRPNKGAMFTHTCKNPTTETDGKCAACNERFYGHHKITRKPIQLAMKL